MPTGRGPVNYNYAGGAPMGWNNDIRYQDMMQENRVTQYNQQMMLQRQQMAAQRNAQVMARAYGSGQGDELSRRLYQRQAVMQQEAHKASTNAAVGKAVTYIGADLATGAAGAAVGTAVGSAIGTVVMPGVGTAIGGAIGGFVGGISTPIIASEPINRMIDKATNGALERQKMAAQTAMDFDVYRNNLGFNRMTYSQAGTAGRQMSNMFGKGSNDGAFFGRDEMSRIHKIAMSNGMVNAKGGMSSGSLEQYKKNFKDLVDTTEEIVKTLNTTIEGGMSVIKELKQSGFKNAQIKNQVRSMTGVAGATGMSTQNVMALGQAGAQAVQGTSWTATAGATMYQHGAVQANNLMYSRAGQAAVQRAGGVAQAGATLANAQMNFLQSGYGTKFLSYAMNADGTKDQSRIDKLVSGKTSAYEVVTGSNQRAYAMGPSGRALFEMNKEKMMNSFTAEERSAMFDTGFSLWSQGRKYASRKARAAVFAGQFSNGPRERDLIYESLLAPKRYDAASATLQSNNNATKGMTDTVTRNGWQKLGRGISRGMGRFGDTLSESFGDAKYWLGQKSAGIGKAIGGGLGGGMGGALGFMAGSAMGETAGMIAGGQLRLEHFTDDRDSVTGNWITGGTRRFFGGNKYTTATQTSMVSKSEAMKRMAGLSSGQLSSAGLTIMARREAEGKAGLSGKTYDLDVNKGNKILRSLNFETASPAEMNQITTALIRMNQSNVGIDEIMKSDTKGMASGLLAGSRLEATDETMALIRGFGKEGVAQAVNSLSVHQNKGWSSFRKKETALASYAEKNPKEAIEAKMQAREAKLAFDQESKYRRDNDLGKISFSRFQQEVRRGTYDSRDYNRNAILGLSGKSQEYFDLETQKGQLTAMPDGIIARKINVDSVKEKLHNTAGILGGSNERGREKYREKMIKKYGLDLTKEGDIQTLSQIAYKSLNDPDKLSDKGMNILNSVMNNTKNGKGAIKVLAQGYEDIATGEAAENMRNRGAAYSKTNRKFVEDRVSKKAADRLFGTNGSGGDFVKAVSGEMSGAESTQFIKDNEAALMEIGGYDKASEINLADLRQRTLSGDKGVTGVSSGATKTASMKMKKRALEAALAGVSEHNASVTVKDGKGGEDTMTALVAQTELDKIETALKGSEQVASSGGERPVTLNPPVVSYWNNKWAV